MSLLQNNQTIRDTYQVEALLGEGAFAEVYRVRHRFLGVQAMKVFKAPGMTIAEIDRVLSEARILSGIGHPNIVRVFDANVLDTPQGTCGFFTMEYVPGGNLEQFWQSYGSRLLPVATTLDVIRQVCRGLAVAHEAVPPIIHRDIKPQNILLGYDAGGLRARLSDFGLARHVNPMSLMATGRGTLAFKAPEVFQDVYSDSCAGDIWGLGSTLYLLLSDRMPYMEIGQADLPDQNRFRRPLVSPSRLNGQVDETLDTIVCRALAVRPEDRYPDARAMLADLEHWEPRRVRKLKPLQPGGSAESLPVESASPTGSPEQEARRMAARAIELSRQPGSLSEAAELMQAALQCLPALREQYGYLLNLWQRGVTM